MPLSVKFEVDGRKLEVTQKALGQNQDVPQLQEWYLSVSESITFLANCGRANRECGIYDRKLSYKLAQYKQVKEWLHRRLCFLGSLPKPGKTKFQEVLEERDRLKSQLEKLKG